MASEHERSPSKLGGVAGCGVLGPPGASSGAWGRGKLRQFLAVGSSRFRAAANGGPRVSGGEGAPRRGARAGIGRRQVLLPCRWTESQHSAAWPPVVMQPVTVPVPVTVTVMTSDSCCLLTWAMRNGKRSASRTAGILLCCLLLSDNSLRYDTQHIKAHIHHVRAFKLEIWRIFPLACNLKHIQSWSFKYPFFHWKKKNKKI